MCCCICYDVSTLYTSSFHLFLLRSEAGSITATAVLTRCLALVSSPSLLQGQSQGHSSSLYSCFPYFSLTAPDNRSNLVIQVQPLPTNCALLNIYAALDNQLYIVFDIPPLITNCALLFTYVPWQPLFLGYILQPLISGCTLYSPHAPSNWLCIVVLLQSLLVSCDFVIHPRFD